MSSSRGNEVTNYVSRLLHIEALSHLCCRSKLRRMSDRAEERAALLALMEERPSLMGERAGKTAWSTIASEVAVRGSALALWEELHPPALDLDDSLIPAIGGEAELLFKQSWETVREWESSGEFELLTVLDAAYPVALREIHQTPPMLFVKGDLRADEDGVSVVGSRKASAFGLSIAANVAQGLADRGVSVISGLAEGIDGAAHEATLEAGGRPIGVIGTGIRRVYPASHRSLHERVAAAGALVSQFFPDAPPTKYSFPMRNVTMSGLGRASVIVEAGEHSGARIQARVAVEHGRPVILTDHVVNETKWGKALEGRPGVYVAGSTADVMGIVELLIADSRSRDLAVLNTGPAPA
ncbi:DNA-processing protein DprA [Mycobacterium paraffinicum]|nr:DNA-processing protein DprA [Mycobacterium paraffinicum]